MNTIHYDSGWFMDEANDFVKAVTHAQRNGTFKNGQPIGEVISFHIRRQGEGWEWERTSIEYDND